MGVPEREACGRCGPHADDAARPHARARQQRGSVQKRLKQRVRHSRSRWPRTPPAGGRGRPAQSALVSTVRPVGPDSLSDGSRHNESLAIPSWTVRLCLVPAASLRTWLPSTQMPRRLSRLWALPYFACRMAFVAPARLVHVIYRHSSLDGTRPTLSFGAEWATATIHLAPIQDVARVFREQVLAQVVART